MNKLRGKNIHMYQLVKIHFPSAVLFLLQHINRIVFLRKNNNNNYERDLGHCNEIKQKVELRDDELK